MAQGINFNSADWMILENVLQALVREEVDALKSPSSPDTTNFIRGKIAAYEEILQLSITSPSP